MYEREDEGLYKQHCTFSASMDVYTRCTALAEFTH
jgi:hypothetical protein